MILPFVFKLLLKAKEPFRNFCEAHLISDDPWPLAEQSTEALVNFAGLFDQVQLKKELSFRLKNNLVEPNLIPLVERILE